MQAEKLSVCASQTSGNDIFYRNPYNVNENLFVDVSSPSSSNFSSVEDLGPPEAAAKRTLNQVSYQIGTASPLTARHRSAQLLLLPGILLPWWGSLPSVCR